MSVGHPRSTKEFNINIDIGLGALVVILAVRVRVMSLRRSTRSRTFAHTEHRVSGDVGHRNTEQWFDSPCQRRVGRTSGE